MSGGNFKFYSPKVWTSCVEGRELRFAPRPGDGLYNDMSRCHVFGLTSRHLLVLAHS